jgi:hypothetical protein
MAFNEHTSQRIASIAGRGLRDLSSVTDEEILEVFASALTQALDHYPAGNAMPVSHPGVLRRDAERIRGAGPLASSPPSGRNVLTGSVLGHVARRNPLLDA